MSDRPNDRKPDEPENSTGWRKADSPGGWRTPQGATTPDERQAWRTPTEQQEGERASVPTLPRDLGVTPQNQGAWHLPQPRDTKYTPEDEIAIAPEAAQEPPAESTESSGEVKPATEPIPSEETQTDKQASTLEPLDEEEDDSFSMSELVALASLVDNVPSVAVQPAPTPAEPSAEQAAGTSDDANDPAAYARRELARLQRLQEQSTAGAPVVEQSQSTSAEQPTSTDEQQQGGITAEEYARRELARLGVTPSPEPAPAAQPAAAAQPAGGDKFRDAENRIRALRQQYQQGQLTRDQFQAELRKAMVLDENQVWWMMGVELDRWYRHDNGQWVPATPPGMAASAAAAPAQPAQQASAVQPTDMGDEGDRTVPTSPVGANLWVPERVPVRDPDYTVPGTGGVYLDSDFTADTVPVASDPYATVPSSGYGGETVANPAIQGQYESVATPMSPADEPPSYDVEAASPTYEDAVAKQRQSTARTIAILAAIAAALIFLIGAVVAIGIVVYYNNLASPWRAAIDNLANYQPQFRTARILAADGSVIAELTSAQGGARDTIQLDQVAPEFIHAIVSIENERFFEDPGWDPVAIGRAFLQNLSSGDIESGASTITQQIARNLILQDTTVSPERKLQEIVIAAEIARKYDKNFILQLYLNEFFFGNQSYGVQAASRFYFGHDADSLNLAESALLAGLLQAPARYDPVINREAAFSRMDTVLNQMAQVGCLQFSFAPYNTAPGFCVTPTDIASPRVVLQKAQVETRNYQPRTFQVNYPHFINFVQQQIENNFGTSEMFRRGFEVRTTLIPRIQDVAQQALETQVKALASNGINTGAVMVSDPRDGAIRAMIGSPDFNDTTIDGQVNNVLTWQQPGSSIKIVEYTAALEGVDRNGTRDYFTPATILWDVPTSYQNPDYTPVNYDNRFHGPLAVRFALANSYNVPAVKTLAFAGIDRFQDVAQRIGLRFLPDATFGLPSALGANEVRLYDMNQAYGTLANNGTRVPLYAITGIQDANGTAVALPDRPQSAQAVQPQVAFLIQNILSDNDARSAAFGANSALNLTGYQGRVAAKTGTSNDNRDIWTMGFSSNVVVGVWMGRVDNAPTVNTSGLAAAPVWNAVMTAALQGTNPTPFSPPQGIVQMQVCADTGTLYDANSPCTSVRTEYFLQNSPPPAANQGFVVTTPVDTWTGLRANQFCTESVVTQTFVNISDPSAVAWLNTAEGQAYARTLGLPTPIEQVPVGECSPSTVLPQVRFSNPTVGQQVIGAINISGMATGTNFDRYQIELAPATTPDNFQIVAGPFRSPQPNGALATWDSTTVPNGAYRLRLAAFATDGGYRYDTIDIGVNNIIPTQPPPTLPPIVVPTDIGATPIPFQPTPTIFFGG